MKQRNIARILMTALALALLAVPRAHAAQAEAQTIRVGWFYQPGYQQTDDTGEPFGYNYEYLMKIAAYNNWTYEFVTEDEQGQELTWESSLMMLKSGRLDLIGCLLFSDERTEDLSFSVLAAGQTFTSLFVREDSPLTEENFSALNGISVAASMATLNDEDLDAYAAECGFDVGLYVHCTTIDDIERTVLEGRADAGVIASYQPRENTRIIASFAPRPFYFGTAKGNVSVLAPLNRAMNAILIGDPYYAQTLSHKYNQTYSGQESFTEEERAYLNQAEPVRVCFSDAWYPLIQYDEATGDIEGVMADVMHWVTQETGLQFVYTHVMNDAEATEMVSTGQCDMLVCCVYNTRHAEQNGIKLSDPYLNVQLVRVSRAGGLSDNYTIGMITGFPDYNEAIQGEGIDFQYYDTAAACFEAMSRGEVEEIIVNSYSAGFYLSRTKYTRYISSTLQGDTTNICIGVGERVENSEILLRVINKALSRITDAEMNQSLLENTIETRNDLESMINRLPTTAAALIILILATVLVLFAFFSLGFVRKSKQAKQKAEEAKLALERVNTLLVMDELTELHNETGFALAARKSLNAFPNKHWFLVDFDVDGFKRYNAVFGFETGNQLLRRLAYITKATLNKAGELSARIYADHFICLAAGENVEQIKNRIIKANAAYRMTDEASGVLLSFGIYPIDDASLPFSAMCDRAQAAKRAVKGNYETIIGVFDESFHQKQQEDAGLVAGMEKGLAKGEFAAFYQPKYDMRTEKIVGAEALVRWWHDEQLIMPNQFISLFESNGLIGKLDFYMLEAACRKLRAQLDEGIEAKPISLNFSRNHIYDGAFLDKLAAAVGRCRVPPGLIVLEFTEYVCLGNESQLRKVIDGIHALGMQVSIDDFGSGFSSLNMLKDMDFDEVKLDKGFLEGTTSVRRSRLIIAAVLSLSKQLQLKTVAEGVETKEQLEFLCGSGCDVAQGYYFSRPIPGEEYDRLLRLEQPAEERFNSPS